MTERSHPRLSLFRGSALLAGLLCLAGCAGWFGQGNGAGVSGWAPMPLQASHLKEGSLVPASGETTARRSAQYVVKIKDGEAEALSRLYFRDRAAAEQSYAEWASDKPLFRQLDLVACSYGGEFVLSHDFTGDPSQDAAANPDALLAALRDHPLVAYADPDFVAQAEGDDGGVL